jgi:adenylate cyclase
VRFVKSIYCLRSSDHLKTRLEIRDEKAHAYRLNPWLALVNILFAFVDCFVVPGASFVEFFLVRIIAVSISRLLYVALRGRAKYGVRVFVTVFPYMAGVEWVMLTKHLLLTPYFAGLSLVMVTSAMLFPVRAKIAYVTYSISLIPVFVWLVVNPLPSSIDLLNVLLMSVGSICVCAVNSGQVNSDFIMRLKAKEALSRNIGKRDKEIRAKADELLRRRVFESQFSPQVVTALFNNPALVRAMDRRLLWTVVIDISDSTSKSVSLLPNDYKRVVEEVFDVFSAACLKWNITLDKFTGDGVQAFAGAPVAMGDEFNRCLMACHDFIGMLRSREDELRLLWRTPLQVRAALCHGEALVGFIGQGAFKSYTAIGDAISFTHRLAGAAEPWTIYTYDWIKQQPAQEDHVSFRSHFSSIAGLKGFSDRTFSVKVFEPLFSEVSPSLGRCAACSTPLMAIDDTRGLPKVICPACEGSNFSKASVSAA